MKKQLNWLLCAVCLILSLSGFCGNDLPRYGGTLVNDFANVIPDDKESTLLYSLKEYENQTGVQIVVVTVNSIGEYDMNSFATTLFNTWGIGQKGADNGLLIVVAPTLRQWYIQPGYGLEAAIPDLECSHVGQAGVVPVEVGK